MDALAEQKAAKRKAVETKPAKRAASRNSTSAKPAVENNTPRKDSSTRQTAQINVRIEAELKAQGDAAFAEAGLTPSEAIRMLYRFAAAHTRNPQAIAKALVVQSDEEKAAREASKQEKLAALERGRQLIPNFLKQQWGIDKLDPSISNLSYKELRDLAFEDELAEEEERYGRQALANHS